MEISLFFFNIIFPLMVIQKAKVLKKYDPQGANGRFTTMLPENHAAGIILPAED